MYTFSEKSLKLQKQINDFMDEYIYPNEHVYEEQLRNAKDRYAVLPIMKELKEKAKAAKLWNLFITPEHAEYSLHGGLTFFEYAPIKEMIGRVLWSAEVFNCSAPDVGNMEVFMKYGSEAQKEKWLKPILAGEMRSTYAMTEPQVASSDATNVEMSIVRDGDEWVINGRKWLVTGAPYELNKIYIFMGKTDPDNPSRHLQQSQVLVPAGTKGLSFVRNLTTLGYDDAPGGHSELLLEDVRVPYENLILGEGRGFEISQGRLAPGRMHHCMRLIGTMQRALEITCKRAEERKTFGRPLAKHQSVRESISKSFCEIEMARLLILKTSHMIDTQGAQASVDMIGAVKTTIPLLAQNMIDRCIQIHGGGGLTSDFMLAEGFNFARWARLADGPDEVHQMALGKKIINRYSGL